MQPQAAGHDVAGDIGQPQITCISIGAQPHECIPDAGAELLGEHPGGLVDLGPARCQVRGLATGRPVPRGRSPPGPGRRAAARWRYRRRSARRRAGRRSAGLAAPGTGPAPRRGSPRSAAGRRRSPPPPPDGPPARRPASGAGIPAGQIRGQHRAARGRGIQARALPQGQVKFGELLADLISDPHQVTRLRTACGTQARAGDLNRSHSRRAHIRGRHPAATAGGLRRDQAPDPARPATCHPRRQRSGSGSWIRPGRLAASGRKPGPPTMGTGPSVRLRRVIALPPLRPAVAGYRAPLPRACVPDRTAGRGQRILLGRPGTGTASPPGASGAAGRLFHAGMDGEFTGQAGDRNNPQHPLPRRGKRRVPAGLPGVPAAQS